MNSIHNPIPPTTRNPSDEQLQASAWLEIFANLACWIGILGLILLITQGAWAAESTPNRGGFSSGVKPGAPVAGNPNEARSPTSANPSFFDDDFDDDDDDDFDSPAFPPPGGRNAYNPAGGNAAGGNAPAFNPSGSHPGAGSPRVFSAGGTPPSGPDPIRTEKGISVGGAANNGVIPGNKGKLPPIKVDDETAEGSKDLVTDFNFPDADILDIAKTLGKLTGKNFILDKDVKGRITIISNSPITVGEAWKVFLTALDINGFALVPSGKYLRISRQRDARDKQLKTYTSDYSPDTDALISRIFSLKYISAEEVARTFRSFMPANSRIIPYEQTNTVIVTDTGSNIAKLAKMLDILDVEGYDAGIEVIPVKYASAAELSKLIDALIPGTSAAGPGGPPGGAPRFGGGGGTSRFSARRTKEGGIINTIISDDRTNTLIVHANTKGADQVRELVAKLDQKVPASQGGRVHVYYLQFADAEQVANTLNNFSQNTTRASPPGGPGGGTGTGVNPISQSLFEGSIKISPDKSTNALVITASPSDFVTVQRVINKLDIPRDQVYVEVAIMEVSVGNQFAYSSNFIMTNPQAGLITNGTDLTNLLTGNFANATGALIPFPFGGNSSLKIGGVDTPVPFSAFGLVRALQGNSSANILATPQIIALDNTEATFESSEKIPIATNTVSATGFSQQSATKEPVVLSIKIKPQINKITNFVKLDVTTKLGNVDNTNTPAQLRNISFGSTDRTAQTSVVVGDSDTVALGGLVRDRTTLEENKVPILGDIPILGWLFKSKQTTVAKNNLLIFMTPHIVRQYEKVREILDRKLKERDEFIETTAGGVDPMRIQRDNIIRSLPDVKDLVQKNPKRYYTQDEISSPPPAAVAVEPEDKKNKSSGTNGSAPGNDSNSTNTGQAVFNPEERAPLPITPEAPVNDVQAQPANPQGNEAPETANPSAPAGVTPLAPAGGL